MSVPSFATGQAGAVACRSMNCAILPAVARPDNAELAVRRGNLIDIVIGDLFHGVMRPEQAVLVGSARQRV